MSQTPGPGYLRSPSTDEPYGYPPQPPFQPPSQPYGQPGPYAWTQPYGQGYPPVPVLGGYGYLPVKEAKKSSALGMISLAMVGICLIIVSAYMFSSGNLIGQISPNGDLTDQQTQGVVDQLGLGFLILTIVSGVVGFAGWIIGIVATAIKRGRAFGVTAIIVGALAPLIAFGAMVIALIPYEL